MCVLPIPKCQPSGKRNRWKIGQTHFAGKKEHKTNSKPIPQIPPFLSCAIEWLTPPLPWLRTRWTREELAPSWWLFRQQNNEWWVGMWWCALECRGVWFWIMVQDTIYSVFFVTFRIYTYNDAQFIFLMNANFTLANYKSNAIYISLQFMY